MSIKIKKVNENAVIPSRVHDDDVGYDLTAISVHKEYKNGAVLFDTGLQVKPPKGYYIEIVPRSSISKTGWILANSVGTIDPNYRGNLYIALLKVKENAPDFELPFTKCQMVLRKVITPPLVVVENLDETKRGSGGFGSTDKE